MITTIETRLRLNATQESGIDSCVALWSWGYRKVWKLWNNQKLSEKQIYRRLMDLNLFTSEQVGSLINKVKTEHGKIKELTKSQFKQKKSKLENIHKFIAKESKLINKYEKELSELKSCASLDHGKIAKLSNSVKKKRLVLKQKSIKANGLNKSINLIRLRMDTDTYKLCFGGSRLLSQRPGDHTDRYRLNGRQKVYGDSTEWKKDWDLSRDNIWYSVGRAAKPQGNAEIQYYPGERKLRLRVTERTYRHRLEAISKETGLNIDELNSKAKYGPYRMKARFMVMENVEFHSKNQARIIQALNDKRPVSARIMKKLTPNGEDIGFYLQLSFEEVILRSVDMITSEPLTMGVDLNQKGLAYCIVKADGNKLNSKSTLKSSHKPYGFIQWDLENKTTEQREWAISNAITRLLARAQEYGADSIAIENLDFSHKIQAMNSGYRSNQKYNKMLTQFVRARFGSMIRRKTERLNMRLYSVNPSFSSVGGFAKYGVSNKLPVDIAASLWLARQALYGKELKTEDNVVFIKKHDEGTTFPYLNPSKRSKRWIDDKLEWRDVSSALGSDRGLWYKNLMAFIRSQVGESLSIRNHEIRNLEPFASNRG